MAFFSDDISQSQAFEIFMGDIKTLENPSDNPTCRASQRDFPATNEAIRQMSEDYHSQDATLAPGYIIGMYMLGEEFNEEIVHKFATGAGVKI